MAEQSELDTLNNFIKNGQTALFTTASQEGNLVTRPMALQKMESNGDMWFFTGSDSHKVAEIASNNEVNIGFESDRTWVSISGQATVVQDREKAEELWNPFVKAYFPGGLEDPNLTMVKVHANTAEYWDADNKPVALFKMMKAAATDTTPDVGDNKTINL